MHHIPYSRQDINQDDINSVIKVLQSPFITQGPKIVEFEESIEKYCNAKYARALSSGTAALHIALLSLDIKPGDIVWTSPISFVASANAALYVGAKVDFIDCNINTGNIDINSLSKKLSGAKKLNKLPKAIIAVHYTGRPCNMEEIYKLSIEYGFKIVEDAAHALGASYNKESKIGSNKYADITMFSFHPVKSITTGEGGVLTTNNEKIAERISLLRSHGITRDEKYMQNQSHGPWYYEQIELGYHYRITDIQAALGISQIQRLDDFILARRNVASYYNNELSLLPIVTPTPDGNSAWHLYVIQVEGKLRHKIFDNLRKLNIGVNVHYIPIHLQPYYEKLGFKKGDFPRAEMFYSRCISIPIFPSLTKEEMAFVVKGVRNAFI